MSVAFHSEHIEMEETGDEIYDDIIDEPPPQDQDDVIYENSQVNAPPQQQQQPLQMLPSGERSSYKHPCVALNGTLRHQP